MNNQIESMLRLMVEYRNHDLNASTSALIIFLTVAKSGQISMTELGKRIKMDKSNLSQVVSQLAHFPRGKKEALGYLRIVEDLTDRRYKNVELTDKGRELYLKLLAVL